MKKIFFILTIILLNFNIFAFDLPITEVSEDAYYSYFGQNRGGLLSSSLVFKDPNQIVASESGHVLIIMDQEITDSDFFPSTLGTVVILSHKDNLISVYANLNKDTLVFKDNNVQDIKKGQLIGEAGNTGWQNDRSTLEFQILDTKNTTAINPKILLSREIEEIPLSMSGIILQSKNGNTYELNQTRTYYSGVYKIFQRRNKVTTPYSTAILINGTISDKINYDTIKNENGKLCVVGKRKYTSTDIYPQDNLQLIGETVLSKGKITLGIISTDITNNQKQLYYNITVY